MSVRPSSTSIEHLREDSPQRVHAHFAEMRDFDNPDNYIIPTIQTVTDQGLIVSETPLYSQLNHHAELPGVMHYTIGTDPSCDFVLPKDEKHEELHAKIAVAKDGSATVKSYGIPLYIVQGRDGKTTYADTNWSDPIYADDTLYFVGTSQKTLFRMTLASFPKQKPSPERGSLYHYLLGRVKSLLGKRQEIITEEGPNSNQLTQLDKEIRECFIAMEICTGEQMPVRKINELFESTRRPFNEKIAEIRAKARKELQAHFIAQAKQLEAEKMQKEQEEQQQRAENLALTKRQKAIKSREKAEGVDELHIEKDEDPETAYIVGKYPAYRVKGTGAESEVYPILVEKYPLGFHVRCMHELPDLDPNVGRGTKYEHTSVVAELAYNEKDGTLTARSIDAIRFRKMDELTFEEALPGIEFPFVKGETFRISNYRIEHMGDHAYTAGAYYREAAAVIEELKEVIRDVELSSASADFNNPDNDDYEAYLDIERVIARCPNDEQKTILIENMRKNLQVSFDSIWQAIKAWDPENPSKKNPTEDAMRFPTLQLLLKIAEHPSFLIYGLQYSADLGMLKDEAKRRAKEYLEANHALHRKSTGERVNNLLAKIYLPPLFNNRQTESAAASQPYNQRMAQIGKKQIARFLEMGLIEEKDLDRKHNKEYCAEVDQIIEVRELLGNLEHRRGDAVSLRNDIVAKCEGIIMRDIYCPEEIEIKKSKHIRHQNLTGATPVAEFADQVIRKVTRRLYERTLEIYRSADIENAPQAALTKMGRLLRDLQVLMGLRDEVGNEIVTIKELVSTEDELAAPHSIRLNMEEIDAKLKAESARREAKQMQETEAAKLEVQINEQENKEILRLMGFGGKIQEVVALSRTDKNPEVLTRLLAYAAVMQSPDIANLMAEYEQKNSNLPIHMPGAPIILSWKDVQIHWHEAILSTARSCARQAVEFLVNTEPAKAAIQHAVNLQILESYEETGYSEQHLDQSITGEKQKIREEKEVEARKMYREYNSEVMGTNPNNYSYLDKPFFPDVTDPYTRKVLDELRRIDTVNRIREILERVHTRTTASWLDKAVLTAYKEKDDLAFTKLAVTEQEEITDILADQQLVNI